MTMTITPTTTHSLAIAPAPMGTMPTIAELLGNDPTPPKTKTAKRMIARYVSQFGHDPISRISLGSYRDALLETKAPQSVQSEITTIRASLARAIEAPATIALLLGSTNPELSISDRKAQSDIMLQMVKASIAPAMSKVTVTKKQDARPTGKRLTALDIQKLLDAIRTDTDTHPTARARNYALILIMLASGIRADEARNLTRADITITDGQAVLYIAKGKGNKARAVPLGAMSKPVLDALARLETPTDALFTSYYKASHDRAPKPRAVMTVQAIHDTIERYATLAGIGTLDPHDLRRTYARRAYETQMPLMAIQQNMGHSNLKTTQAYIGELDTARVPNALW